MTRARDVANLIGSGNYSSTTFTATAGQTAFSISHTQGFVQVFMNGLLLDLTTDYTSNGSAITLTSGAAAGDEIEVVKYNTFSVGDAIAKSGGTFTGNVSMSGTLGVTGAVTASNGLTVDDDGATVLTVDRATSDGDIIDIQRGGTSAGKIGGTSNVLSIVGKDGDGGIAIQNNSYGDIIYPASNSSGGASDNAIDLGYNNGRWKNLYLSGGVYIGGTGSANYLDDYEEGEWTPTVGAVTGQTQPTVTAGTFTGSYVKIGRIVHAVFYVGPFQFNSTGSGSALAIGGFPFNHSGANSVNGDVTLVYYVSWARPNYVGLRPYSTNDFGFLSVNNGGNWGWETCSAAGTGGSRYISGSISYYTNS